MTRQDDGTKSIDGQRTIGELHAIRRKNMTNKTENQCPNCGHNTLALKLYDDGSGKVHCKRTNCDYKEGFTPHGPR